MFKLSKYRSIRRFALQLTSSHIIYSELRTPIHQIQNMTSVLKSSLPENSTMQNLEMKGGLEDIENASIQLETVMRNILSYVSQTVLSRPVGIA